MLSHKMLKSLKSALVTRKDTLVKSFYTINGYDWRSSTSMTFHTVRDHTIELENGVANLRIDGVEYERFKGWGHSTWRHGLEISQAAGVKTFIAFHHDPGHDDAFMDAVGENLRAIEPGSLVAIEGMTVDLLTGNLETP